MSVTGALLYGRNLINNFDAFRWERWRRGVQKYRPSQDAPFNGCPVQEMKPECADIMNYRDQAIREMKLNPYEAGRIEDGVDLILDAIAASDERRRKEANGGIPIDRGGDCL